MGGRPFVRQAQLSARFGVPQPHISLWFKYWLEQDWRPMSSQKWEEVLLWTHNSGWRIAPHSTESHPRSLSTGAGDHLSRNAQRANSRCPVRRGRLAGVMGPITGR